MTAPLDQQAIRERHGKVEDEVADRSMDIERGDCRACRMDWPCDAIQALDALGEAERKLTAFDEWAHESHGCLDAGHAAPKADLASSPDAVPIDTSNLQTNAEPVRVPAAWRETAREVVEALARLAGEYDGLAGSNPARWREIRALLARPEVQKMRGK